MSGVFASIGLTVTMLLAVGGCAVTLTKTITRCLAETAFMNEPILK